MSEIPIRERVRNFLNDRFESAARMEDSESLLQNGILDSAGVMELVIWLESDFGLILTNDEMTADNFDSVDAIVTFLTCRSNFGPAETLDDGS